MKLLKNLDIQQNIYILEINLKTFRQNTSIQIIYFFAKQIMNINDKSVLEMLNKLIAINRLNKIQVLKMVDLVSLSNNIDDLKDNLKWENSNSFH